MNEFSFETRQKNIEFQQENIFDLAIIGGGINGAGIARDASLRGMKVALIEANDFASGTSSRSSKLIHGGIRYLENLDFKLVFEALNERSRLFEMAPHLVHPLRFMIPLYANSRVTMNKMGLGMWLYDALSLFQTPEIHERLDELETLLRMPILKPTNLCGSFVYSDAYMDDDRLVHETLRSANFHGAICANYVKAGQGIYNSKGQLQAVECTDVMTDKKWHLKAHHFISTVGPWTDIWAETVLKNWKPILRPTKGVHITLHKDRLPLSSAVVMGAENSDRIVFGIPRHEMVIIGTTDTDFKENPSTVVATKEDISYLLKIVEYYFPGARIKESDIIASYAGVRPLVRDDSSSEGKTSREHTIMSDPRGLTFVAGGKYTTYRLMSEQAVDHVLRYFPIEDRARFVSADTAKALNTWVSVENYQRAQQQIDLYQRTSLLDRASIKKLVDRYGLEIEELFHRLPETLNYWEIEAHQAINTTMCLHLRDFFCRRVPLFLAETDHGQRYIEIISKVFQEKLGWSDMERKGQMIALKEYTSRELSWRSSL